MSYKPLNLWKADHFRITVFGAPGWMPDAEEIFGTVFQSTPDAVTTRTAFGEKSVGGVLAPTLLGRCEVKVTLNRVDFFVTPGGSDEPGLQLLDDISTRFRTLAAGVGGWLTTLNAPMSRLAVGTGGLLQARTRREGYEFLRDLVRVAKVDVDRFQDFQLQVNLPAASRTVPSIQLNRVTTWASVIISPNLFFSPANSRITSAVEAQFCRCQIDVNTDPKFSGAFEAGQLSSLLNELLDSGFEILERGIE